MTRSLACSQRHRDPNEKEHRGTHMQCTTKPKRRSQTPLGFSHAQKCQKAKPILRLPIRSLLRYQISNYKFAVPKLPSFNTRTQGHLWYAQNSLTKFLILFYKKKKKKSSSFCPLSFFNFFFVEILQLNIKMSQCPFLCSNFSPFTSQNNGCFLVPSLLFYKLQLK